MKTMKTIPCYYACKSTDIENPESVKGGALNFGDHITPYIIQKLGFNPVWTPATERHIMLSGSILREASNKSLVLGAGFGARDQKFRGQPNLQIVRGKITTKLLVDRGLKKTWLEGDPALILPLIYLPYSEKKYKLGIIPHYIDKNDLTLIKTNGNIKIIDIQQPVEKVIDDIVSCEKTISSTLHGIIASHAYGVPSLWVKFSDKIAGDGMKYLDYFSSVGITGYKVVEINHRVGDDIAVPIDVGRSNPDRLLKKIESELLNFKQ